MLGPQLLAIDREGNPSRLAIFVFLFQDFKLFIRDIHISGLYLFAIIIGHRGMMPVTPEEHFRYQEIVPPF
jgi:hypothetical protein